MLKIILLFDLMFKIQAKTEFVYISHKGLLIKDKWSFKVQVKVTYNLALVYRVYLCISGRTTNNKKIIRKQFKLKCFITKLQFSSEKFI